MQGSRGNVLPIYFVGDESHSMQGDPIDHLNQALVALRDEAARSPAIGEVARFGILTFAGDPLCRLEPAPLRADMQIPTLACRDGGTVYSSVFRELKRRLPGDVAALKAAGYNVHRPLVFFLSDGQPTDRVESEWVQALEELKSEEFHERPSILAFGMGEAQPQVIGKVATSLEYAWVAADGQSAATAVAEFGASLIESISRSAENLRQGIEEIQAPEPKGYLSLRSPVI
jgi:uncharacterized protein YegL